MPWRVSRVPLYVKNLWGRTTDAVSDAAYASAGAIIGRLLLTSVTIAIAWRDRRADSEPGTPAK